MIVKDWEMLSQQQEDMNVSTFLSAQPLTRCAVIERPTDSLIPSNPSTRSLTPLCLRVFLCHSFCWSIPLSSLYFSFSFLSTSSCFFTIQDSEGPYNWLSRLVRNIFVSRSIRKKKKQPALWRPLNALSSLNWVCVCTSTQLFLIVSVSA